MSGLPRISEIICFILQVNISRSIQEISNYLSYIALYINNINNLYIINLW
jgi:hypothetical protein